MIFHIQQLETVSYTHLDVYKRQYVDRRGEQVGYYRTKGVARKRYIEDKYVK